MKKHYLFGSKGKSPQGQASLNSKLIFFFYQSLKLVALLIKIRFSFIFLCKVQNTASFTTFTSFNQNN